jgi:YidC/Oxa1 family membrane protein insertase
MINRATAKLFEDAKANPLAGCLVSILQLPIFLGLYRGVNLLAKEGNLNEPFLFIPSLEGPVSPPDFRGLDWITSGWHTGWNGLPEPGLGWSMTLAFLVMPVVLVLGQAITMSTLSAPPDENASSVEKEQYEKTQGILRYLPLLIGYFSMQVPAGLTIYWFTSNLFTLLQSISVRGYYKANPPKIELPDYWSALDNAEGMSPAEKREAAKAGLSVGPKMEDMIDGMYKVALDHILRLVFCAIDIDP